MRCIAHLLALSLCLVLASCGQHSPREVAGEDAKPQKPGEETAKADDLRGPEGHAPDMVDRHRIPARLYQSKDNPDGSEFDFESSPRVMSGWGQVRRPDPAAPSSFNTIAGALPPASP